MRLLALIAIGLSACASGRHVFVPNTPEAAKCWRECRAIAATCANNPHVGRLFLEQRCEDERLDCLLTCPGARETPPQ